MLISISEYYSTIVSILLLLALMILGYLFIIKEQDSKLNWAIFYSTLYIVVVLPIANYLCIEFDFWSFSKEESNSIQLPYELYFLWIILWGILPVYIFRGRYRLFIALVLLWLDILLMPLLGDLGILRLNRYWLIGELLLLASVFLPAYYWAYCSFTNKNISVRALLQVVVMTGVFMVGLPFILSSYGLITHFENHFAPFTFQLFLIVAFPGLIAVFDLVAKGRGTAFPYDPTKNLVETGVYAYCRNPIQWSFTLIFIPMSIYYSSFYFLIGSVFSVAYAYGVSDYQEYSDMEKRFGAAWKDYKMNVPRWRFLWKPKSIPKGVVYFDANCEQCSQVSRWFSKSKAINLEIRESTTFPKKTILQVTYIDHNGIEYKSMAAIASCLEHINLAYATLGWFIRFPLINPFLQLIIDSMEFRNNESDCHVEK